jgi:hypothetical protein
VIRLSYYGGYLVQWTRLLLSRLLVFSRRLLQFSMSPPALAFVWNSRPCPQFPTSGTLQIHASSAVDPACDPQASTCLILPPSLRFRTAPIPRALVH